MEAIPTGRVVSRARRHKYGAQPTIVDGLRFASKREARRYSELRLLDIAGEIDRFRWQVRYPLSVNGARLGHYVADFVYRDIRTGSTVVEDTKGVRTALYKWKAKHMQAEHGITIREV